VTERVDVPVTGGSLAVNRLGGAPDAPVVLAIHGITSTSQTWIAVAETLGSRATLAAVDLRGRGRSNELPAPFGLTAHVTDMVALLDTLGLDQTVVVGHSLGAYVAAALADAHPERVQQLVLVDGGLTVPGARNAEADAEQFLRAFLGAALARLQMTFPDREAYRAWWSEHPAVAGSDIAAGHLAVYADYDLIGPLGAMRSSVNPECVAPDGRGVIAAASAGELTVPAVLLCAPRGLAGEPNPMQPLPVVEAWAAADPERRRGQLVPNTNHYSIVLGRHGAGSVAAEIAGAV
jgi:pimeloyl-ACP methyl ester carboxylesterase